MKYKPGDTIIHDNMINGRGKYEAQVLSVLGENDFAYVYKVQVTRIIVGSTNRDDPQDVGDVAKVVLPK